MGNKYFSFICLLALTLQMLSWELMCLHGDWVDYSWTASQCLCERRRDSSSSLLVHLMSANEVWRTDSAGALSPVEEHIWCSDELLTPKLNRQKEIQCKHLNKKSTHIIADITIPLLQVYLMKYYPYPLEVCSANFYLH